MVIQTKNLLNGKTKHLKNIYIQYNIYWHSTFHTVGWSVPCRPLYTHIVFHSDRDAWGCLVDMNESDSAAVFHLTGVVKTFRTHQTEDGSSPVGEGWWADTVTALTTTKNHRYFPLTNHRHLSRTFLENRSGAVTQTVRSRWFAICRGPHRRAVSLRFQKGEVRLERTLHHVHGFEIDKHEPRWRWKTKSTFWGKVKNPTRPWYLIHNPPIFGRMLL